MATPLQFRPLLGHHFSSPSPLSRKNTHLFSSSRYATLTHKLVDMAFLCSSGQCCLVVKASAKSGSAGQSQSVKTVRHQPNHGAQTLNPVKKNSTLTTLPKAPPLVETTTTTALSPDLLETVKNVEVISRSEKNAVVPRVSVAGNYTVKGLFRQLVRQLASLPLAIAELFAIAGLSAIGMMYICMHVCELFFSLKLNTFLQS